MAQRFGRRRGMTAPAAAVAALLAVAGCSDGGTTDGATTDGATSAPSRSATSADRDLFTAAERGDATAVRSALAAGADVRAVDDTGATALLKAAYGNHVEAATVLVDAGADVNHKDRSVQSAYLVATSEVGDDPRLLELTLARGGDVGAHDSFDGTGLIRAAHRGYPQVVDRLLAAGIEKDHVNNLGWTALLEAVILGDGGPDHQAVVRSLVAAGADTGVRDKGGMTALDHARADGQTAVAALLSP
jgi:hypothetical protein